MTTGPSRASLLRHKKVTQDPSPPPRGMCEKWLNWVELVYLKHLDSLVRLVVSRPEPLKQLNSLPSSPSPVPVAAAFQLVATRPLTAPAPARGARAASPGTESRPHAPLSGRCQHPANVWRKALQCYIFRSPTARVVLLQSLKVHSCCGATTQRPHRARWRRRPPRPTERRRRHASASACDMYASKAFCPMAPWDSCSMELPWWDSVVRM